MPKRKQPGGDAAGGGGGRGRGRGGGGYNNGNYQGHGNWGNTPNYPTHPHYNQNPQMGQYYNQNPHMGQYYNHNPHMGQGYNTYQGHGNWGNIPNYPTPPHDNQTLQMGPGYNQNPQMGQGYNTYQGHGNCGNTPNYPTPHPNYNQNPQMGQGHNTYQFEPNVPWQPGNEPSNQFSQSRQASQTQQSQNNGGQQGRRRKKPKKSHEVEKVSPCQVETNKGPTLDIANAPTGGGPQGNFHEEIKFSTPVQAFGRHKVRELKEGIKRQFPEDADLHALIWRAPVLVRGSSTTATPVVLFEPIRKRLPAAEDDGFLDDAETLPDAENNEESNTQALAQNTSVPNAQVPAQTEPGVCGACKMPGHEVIQCWQIGPDGFTHGCGVCNSGTHETDQCQGFPKDVIQKIEILVKRRACLPPLKTAFWYNMMWKWVKNNPSTDVNHLFPWTTQFAIDVLNGDRKSAVEEALINRRNNPDAERSQFLIDPATANWEKVKGTYGGDPKNFFEKLRAAKGAVQEQRVPTPHLMNRVHGHSFHPPRRL